MSVIDAATRVYELHCVPGGSENLQISVPGFQCLQQVVTMVAAIGRSYWSQLLWNFPEWSPSRFCWRMLLLQLYDVVLVRSCANGYQLSMYAVRTLTC